MSWIGGLPFCSLLFRESSTDLIVAAPHQTCMRGMLVRLGCTQVLCCQRQHTALGHGSPWLRLVTVFWPSRGLGPGHSGLRRRDPGLLALPVALGCLQVPAIHYGRCTPIVKPGCVRSTGIDGGHFNGVAGGTAKIVPSRSGSPIVCTWAACKGKQSLMIPPHYTPQGPRTGLIMLKVTKGDPA